MSEPGDPNDAGVRKPTLDQAADRATAEPTALMSGERPDSPHLDDAEHWCAVYEELHSFKRALLSEARERIDRMTP